MQCPGYGQQQDNTVKGEPRGVDFAKYKNRQQ